jgi:hypothetical protein
MDQERDERDLEEQAEEACADKAGDDEDERDDRRQEREDVAPPPSLAIPKAAPTLAAVKMSA